MNHGEMDDLYELFCMGVLEPEPAAEIERHLGEGCEHCAERLREARYLLAGMATAVEPAQPSSGLRSRVLAIAGKDEKQGAGGKRGWVWVACAAAAAALMVLVWGVSMARELAATRRSLAEVSRQRNELRAAIAILGQADSRTVRFGEEENEPHGRVFVSQNGGVVFLGSRLPSLEGGKTFELWLVPAKGKPQAAGLFRPNEQGIAVHVLAQRSGAADYAAVAVSVEPEGGSVQPSGKPILVVPL